MPAPNIPTAPSRFFGKSKNGDPCLIYDSTAVQMITKKPPKATYTAAPLRVRQSRDSGTNVVEIRYPGKINPDQLSRLNALITAAPYVTLFSLQYDGTIRKQWFHATGGATIKDNKELSIPFDTQNSVPTTKDANVITSFLCDFNPDNEPESVYSANTALSTIECYVTPAEST